MLRGVIVHFKAHVSLWLKRCFSFDCQGRVVYKLQSELNLDNIITQSAWSAAQYFVSNGINTVSVFLW